MTRVLPDGTTAGSTLARNVLAVLIAMWLVVPLLIVVGLSFTGRESFVFPPPDWSLRWYRALSDPQWFEAARNSVVIAVITALCASVLGTAASFTIVRSRSRVLRSLRLLVLAPQVMPVIIVALGLFLLFLRWRLIGTYGGFVIAHTALVLPFVVIPVTAALETFDRTLEQASANLGAGPLTTFLQVTLPSIRPAVIGGAAIAFLSSLDEAVVGIYLSTPSLRTLPVVLFQSMTDRIDPTVAAVASIQIVLVTVGVLLVLAFQLRSARRESRRRADAASARG